ncbi:SCF-dependent proteasomal ubiquitin-dependent protein catabolic process [Sorochytrium milnesiophthora]
MEYRMVVPEAHSLSITCMVHNPHRRELFTGSEDFSVKMWDLETGRLLNMYVAHTGWVTGMVFWCDLLQMHDGKHFKRLKLLLTASLDGTVVVWGASMKVVDRLQTGEPIYSLSWNARRQQVMVGHQRKVRVFVIREEQGGNITTPNEVIDKTVSTSCEEHEDIVSALTSCEARFYSVGYDKKLVIYDSLPHALKMQVVKRIYNAHDAAISYMSYGKDADNAWIITGSFDRVVKMWSLDGHCLQRFDGFSAPVSGLCYISPTQTLWVAASTCLPIAYDPKSGINVTDFMGLDEEVIAHAIGSRFTVRSLLFIPESNEAVATTTRRTLIFWRYNAASPITTLQCVGETAEALTFSTSSICLSGGVNNITRWERIQLNSFIYSHEQLQFPKEERPVATPNDSAMADSAAKHPLSKRQMFGSRRVDSKAGGSTLDMAPCERPKLTVLRLVYYEPLDLLIAAFEERRIMIWGYNEDGLDNDQEDDMGEQNGWGADVSNRVAGMSCKMQFHTHHDAVLALAALSYQDKHYLLSSGNDRRLCLYDLAAGDHLETFRDTTSSSGRDELAADGPVLDIAYASECNMFAYASADKQVYVRRFARHCNHMQLVSVLQGHEAEVTAVCWNSKTEQWVSASEDRTIRVWEKEEPLCLQVIVNSSEITALCVDSLNGCVIVGGRDKVLRVYDGETLVQKNVGHKDEIRAITHLYGRNQYATASWDGTVKVWNAYLKKGQRRHEYTRAASVLDAVPEPLMDPNSIIPRDEITSPRQQHVKELTKGDVRDDLEHAIQSLQRSMIQAQLSAAGEDGMDKRKQFSL